MKLHKLKLHKCVDYTLLKPGARKRDFVELCQEAKEYSKEIRSVCLLPDPTVVFVSKAELKLSDIIICCVNDFPLGRGGAALKQKQALIVRESGAEEIDTVINAGALRDGFYKRVLNELRAVTDVFPGATKVILETGHSWYTERLIKKATELVAEAGAFCVKTSTGFIENIPVEEKVQHVKWMHEAVPELVKKVAGGVKKPEHAQLFFDIVRKDKLIFGASAKFWLEE